MGVRAVLFDWGDTLVRYPGFSTDGGGHLAAVAELHAWLGAGMQRECFGAGAIDVPRFIDSYCSAASEQFARIHETGRDQPLDARLVQTLRLAGCRCELSAPEVATIFDRFVAILCAHTAPMPDADRVLGAIGEHYLVAVVANFPEPRIVRETLRRHRLDRFFEVVVISAEVGRVKPDPLPFRTAMDALGVAPEDVLFVGDDVVNDMAGAKALGCTTAWMPPVTPGREPAPGTVDHALRGLAELLELPALDRLPGRAT